MGRPLLPLVLVTAARSCRHGILSAFFAGASVERRYATFIAASLAIVLGSQLLQAYFFP
jgi:hypothetical protein